MTNSINVTDPNALTTPVNNVARTKYFPFEVHAVNLMPFTKYSVSYNGQTVNAFCKQFGKNLGAQLISDGTGKITFLFLMGIPHNQTYLVSGSPVSNNAVSLVQSSATLQLT